MIFLKDDVCVLTVKNRKTEKQRMLSLEDLILTK